MLEKIIQKLYYTLYKGELFQKAPEEKYTFVRCCPVNQFVHAALSNHKMADLMAYQVNHVASILRNKGSHIVMKKCHSQCSLMKLWRTVLKKNLSDVFLSEILSATMSWRVPPKIKILFKFCSFCLKFCLNFVHFISNESDQNCTFLSTSVPSCNTLFTILPRF